MTDPIDPHLPRRPAQVHPACQEFVATVETLQARRRAEAARASSHPPAAQFGPWGPRSWHRTELEDAVYSSYKQMRQGRITRPPRREVVMAIADYLDCTLAERNRLLLAARAAPVSPYLTGERLNDLLAVAVSVAQQLDIPALVINRDWRVHYQNDQMLRAFAITPEQLAAIPADQRNVLSLLCDPALPLYPNLIAFPESWERMIRQTIYAFKLANLLCQHEPWYAELVDRLLRLPAFAAHWPTVQVDTNFEYDPSALQRDPAVTIDVVLARPLPGADRLQLRPLVISVGYFQFDFPLVLAFVPAADPVRLRDVAAPSD